MAIQCWALAPEGGPLSQCKVTLRFHGLVLQGLEHFGSQNVIFELVIVDIAEDPLDTSTTNHYRSEVVDSMRFRVWLDMSWGCSGSFGCAAIEVLSVEPVG